MPLGELNPVQNLVALYHLSNTSDSSGNNYTLTNNNTVTFSDYAKFGKCADFGTSNTNKYLNILNNNLGISGSSDFTISAWVKLRTEIGSGSYDFINLNTGTTAGNTFYILGYEYNSGNRRIYGYFGSNQITYTTTLGTTNWYYLNIVRSSNNTYLYLNGALVATGTVNLTTPASYGFGIGGQHNGANYSSAVIDEVAVFSKALSDREIANYYQWASGRFAKLI